MTEIKRPQYLNALIKKRDNGRVKIITGLRRCGKSYLLFHLYRNHLLQEGVPDNRIVMLALDELKNASYRNPIELDRYIRDRIGESTEHHYIFIDEIQFCAEVQNPYLDNPEEKLTFIDTILGLMRVENLDIYITGSNSKMLSKDILTQFRDRGDEIHVMPLSFAEFWEAYRVRYSGTVFPITFPASFEMADKSAAWRDYYTFGGMPEILSIETVEEKSRKLKNLFDETYLKDIVERYDIRNEENTLGILLDFVSSNIGSLTNPLKLEHRFKSETGIGISHNTISNYLTYFEESYIIDSAQRYDIKGSRYLKSPLKYYYTDVGLRNARLNFRQIEETHLMENILYNDLVRRGYNVDVGEVVYTLVETDIAGVPKKQRNTAEVDFVVNHGNNRLYIQSALSIEDAKKREQETNSLYRIKDSFAKIIVTKEDFVPWHDEKGVRYIGLWEFLLGDDII